MLPLKSYFKDPKMTKIVILEHFGQWLPDKTYLKWMFRIKMGRRLDLKNPKTYNEKLQWIKLYDRKPEYTMMVDKFAVKDYVAKIIGDEYIIPTLGVWDRPEDIDFDNLPNKFVLKTTHGGGSTGVVICKDKDIFDREKAVNRLGASMKQRIYPYLKEWPYKNVSPRIIAEKYIEPTVQNDDLPDYKFFCFDGEVKALFVATERQSAGDDVKFDFFDADFNLLPFRQGHDHANVTPTKPQSFEEMKTIASKLSKGIPQVRVDLYESNGRPLFGELTFFHFGAFMPFEPEEWDYTFGNWITLPKTKIS